MVCVAIRWFLQKTNQKAWQIKQMPSSVIKIEHIATYFCRLERICWWIQVNICSCLHTCDNVTEVSLGGMYSSWAQHAVAYFWCTFPYCPTKCSYQTTEFVCIRAVVGETYPLTYSPHYDSLCVFIVWQEYSEHRGLAWAPFDTSVSWRPNTSQGHSVSTGGFVLVAAAHGY